jgi:probable HAF family extracellular repeat protein
MPNGTTTSIRWVPAVLLAFLGAGCGGGDAGQDITGPAPVATVSVSPASADVEIGSSVQLSAVPTDGAGAALSDRAVSWSSGQPTVATVNQQGLVSGVSAGEATITAASEGKSGSATITVRPAPPPPPPPPPASVHLPDTATTIIEGLLNLRATNDAGGFIPPRDLQWTSRDPAIARVDEAGLVTGVAPGRVGIIARSAESADTCRITVLPIISLDGLPYDINSAGTVVGQINRHAFVWTRSAGVRELTGRPGDPTHIALGIADNGTVVGVSGGGDFTSDHPVVWTFDGSGAATVRELPWTGGPTGFTGGISPRGDRIAGQVLTQPGPNNYAPYPAVWTRRSDASWSLDLLPIPEAAFGGAFGLNDKEEVVGIVDAPSATVPGQYTSSAVLWRRSSGGSWLMETLATGELGSTNAAAVNASGVVVGSHADRAVRWIKIGSQWTMTDLGTLGGTDFSFAADISDSGEVVGGTFDATGRQRPFLWKEGEGMRDLGSLTSQATARRINNSADVLGLSQSGNTLTGTLWLGR